MDLDEELYRQLEYLAVRRGVQVSDLVCGSLRLLVDEPATRVAGSVAGPPLGSRRAAFDVLEAFDRRS